MMLIAVRRAMMTTAMTIQEYFQNYILQKQLQQINFGSDSSVQYTNIRIDTVVQNILNKQSQNIGRLQILNRLAVGLLQQFSHQRLQVGNSSYLSYRLTSNFYNSDFLFHQATQVQVTSYNWNQMLNRRSISKRIYNSANDFLK
ncbi:Hypothetical_protein [Hexamita inflata]|uniref:Hypothetical_protein n=1 Tax=Hexamita inflata TaxID=28002 RepID=A0ABP1GDC2_9EUKA